MKCPVFFRASKFLLAAWAVGITALVFTTAGKAQTFTVLHNFTGGSDGAERSPTVRRAQARSGPLGCPG